MNPIVQQSISMSPIVQALTQDFAIFGYVLLMDESNLQDSTQKVIKLLLQHKLLQDKNFKVKIELLKKLQSTKATYYQSSLSLSDFETVCQQCQTLWNTYQ